MGRALAVGLVHLIITMIKWIRTSRLSIKKSLCWGMGRALAVGLVLPERTLVQAPQADNLIFSLVIVNNKLTILWGS